MHHFSHRGGELACEEVSLAQVAEAVGTPVYVYSTATLERHVRVIAEAMHDIECLIAFSVKANGNLAVLATLAAQGVGADVVSGGELQRARRAGIPARKIVFSGVGKTREEMRLGLAEGIYQFNVESVAELRTLSEVACDMGRTASVAIRVNPDVEAGGHPNISTGKAGDKFGVPWDAAPAVFDEAARLPGLSVVGVDVHIGSQIDRLAPMRAAFAKTVALAKSLQEAGHAISRLDLGGGLGVPYARGDAPASPAAYAEMIADVIGDFDGALVLEPGRVIAANAGVLLTRALYLKNAPDRTFLVVDAGMNDFLRPALYDAHHEIVPVKAPRDGDETRQFDVVGPVCESTDRFAVQRALTGVAGGDLLAIMSTGAYGAALSSQYNARPLVPEVLVRGQQWHTVRRRPSFEEMIQLETYPEWKS
ncbi:MAG: diaminopimelate decarboxylase [Pseudomonadota bacterium]